MTRFGLIISLASIFASWAFAQSKGELFAPRDANFTVRFPARPRETTTTPKSPIGELKVHTATFAGADGNVFMASYTDFPAGTMKPATRGTIFDGVREGLKGKDGSVLEENEIEVGLEKLPGRSLVLKKGEQQVRFRVILREDRLYQLAVVGTPSFVQSREAAGFLESFVITR